MRYNVYKYGVFMGRKILNKSGYTLAEVIITMIIVSIVISVSMKATKTRLTNIKMYTYYSAYTTLSDVNREIFSDFDLCDNAYMLTPGGGAITDCNTVPQSPATLPRLGSNFCSKFVSLVNTRGSVNGSNECNGDAVSESDSSFGSKKPDVILSNGMKVYNIRQNPAKIAKLSGNSRGKNYVTGSGQTINIDEYGYTAYVDIDGDSGNSILWEDVYPFYVTMSGRLYPAYNMALGGAGKDYLQMGLYYETLNESGRKTNWLAKSATFKEVACKAGYAKQNTTYCKTSPAVTTNAVCSAADGDCRIVPIPPVRFFN